MTDVGYGYGDGDGFGRRNHYLSPKLHQPTGIGKGRGEGSGSFDCTGCSDIDYYNEPGNYTQSEEEWGTGRGSDDSTGLGCGNGTN